MKLKHALHSITLVLALVAGSAYGQLIYTPGPAVTQFNSMKADGSFIANTLLNLGTFQPVPDFDGQIHSFNFAGLTVSTSPGIP